MEIATNKRFLMILTRPECSKIFEKFIIFSSKKFGGEKIGTTSCSLQLVVYDRFQAEVPSLK